MRKSDHIISKSGDKSGSKCECRTLALFLSKVFLQSVTTDMKIPLDGKK